MMHTLWRGRGFTIAFVASLPSWPTIAFVALHMAFVALRAGLAVQELLKIEEWRPIFIDYDCGSPRY